MRIFCELRSIFPSPAGARKNTSNEQNVRSYYMLNHRIRGLLFHYKKKNVILQLASIFLGKSIQKHPDSVCENDVNSEQTVRAYYAKPLNERLNKLFYIKILLFWLLFSILFSSVGSSSLAIVAPFASAGIRPVVNRFNQDTTVYYGLVFCAFS